MMSSMPEVNGPAPFFPAARLRMVQYQIAARGIDDPRVLEVMSRVPRERFVPQTTPADLVYSDQALPIACQQTISQPFIVAWMTAALDVRPGMKVLEVGTGSGYQAALLVALGARLFSIERVAELSRQAEENLAAAGLVPAELIVGDGSVGLPREAPFDRIMVTAASPAVPWELCEQLAVGGRLVMPVGGGEGQLLIRIDRRRGRVIESCGLRCRFVRLVGSGGWSSESDPA